MRIPRKAHEWAADRFSFVQYPKRYRSIQAQKPDLIDKLFKYGLFAWLMLLIWGGVVFWAIVIAYLYFSADPSIV